MSSKCIVAGCKVWNRTDFDELPESVVEEWAFVATSKELMQCLENSSEWSHVFFLHWSEKVPDEVLAKHECVCFHMTDVPFGRGGTPLQNLIVRGFRETVLTALRMSSEFDAGPVYFKRPLTLEGSTAEEIYMRASRLSCEMALEIASGELSPKEQEGEPVVFRRRNAYESELPDGAVSLEQLHDHIRMLDADGYPPAFLDLGNYRIEFRGSSFYGGRIEANVRIVPLNEKS